MAERRIRVVFRRSGPGTSDGSGALVSSRRPEWHPPPGGKWVRPDLNRSRQHPKLVGFLVSGKTGGPRAQTKLPHGPAGSSRMSEALKTLPRKRGGRPRDLSSERQDFVDEFRVGEDHPAATVPLQAELVQHLPGRFSAARSLDERREGAADDFAAREASDRDDHGSPVRLLPLLARAASERFLRELAACVGDDQRPIVFPEEGLEIVVAQILDEAARDRGADRVGLAHDAAALHVHVDVDRVDFLPGELQRLQDLQAPQLERIDFDRHAVDADDAPPLRERRPRDRGLSLSARDDRLHGDTSNLEPRSFEISPRLMNGPWGGLLATSTISRGLSLYASGTERYTRRRFKASRPRGC